MPLALSIISHILILNGPYGLLEEVMNGEQLRRSI